MGNKKLFYSPLASFIIFLVIVAKDILVGYFEIIPIRSPQNRLVSWFLILPLIIIGFILSIKIVKHYYNYIISNRRVLVDWVLLLSLPTFLYISYFVIRLIVGICYFRDLLPAN